MSLMDISFPFKGVCIIPYSSLANVLMCSTWQENWTRFVVMMLMSMGKKGEQRYLIMGFEKREMKRG